MSVSWLGLAEEFRFTLKLSLFLLANFISLVKNGVNSVMTYANALAFIAVFS